MLAAASRGRREPQAAGECRNQVAETAHWCTILL